MSAAHMYAFNVVSDPTGVQVSSIMEIVFFINFIIKQEYDHTLHHQSPRAYRNDYGTPTRYLKCESSPPITPPRVITNIRTATPHHIYHSSSSIQNHYRMNTNPSRINTQQIDDNTRHY